MTKKVGIIMKHYQPSCVDSQQSDLCFCLFHTFSNFTPPAEVETDDRSLPSSSIVESGPIEVASSITMSPCWEGRGITGSCVCV